MIGENNIRASAQNTKENLRILIVMFALFLLTILLQ